MSINRSAISLLSNTRRSSEYIGIMVSSLRTSSLNQSSGGFVGKNVNSGLCRFPLSIRSSSVGTKIKQEDTFELCKKTVKSINFKNIVYLIQRWLNLKSNSRVWCKYIIKRRVITKKKKTIKKSKSNAWSYINIIFHIFLNSWPGEIGSLFTW